MATKKQSTSQLIKKNCDKLNEMVEQLLQENEQLLQDKKALEKQLAQLKKILN